MKRKNARAKIYVGENTVKCVIIKIKKFQT
jgi:hypothetical protein